MMKILENEKLAVSFHRTFALRRSGVSQLLALAVDMQSSNALAERRAIDYTNVWEKTSLGTIDAQATSRYAFGLGLISRQGLTRFGSLVYARDPNINDKVTQWVFHYHMCAPHRVGPIFWGHLATTLSNAGDNLTAETLAVDIRNLYVAQGDKALKTDTYKGAAVAFLGTYAKWDGLGSLGILAGSVNGVYAVGDPVPAPWRVAAYALADYWQAHWDDRMGVNMESVRDVGALLLVGSGEMNGFLRTMQEHGLVDVQRRHPPYQVMRQFSSADDVLEHLYDADDA